MLYHYIASDKTGKILEGNFEAETLNQVLQFLGGRELRPVSVKQIKQTNLPFRHLFGGINLSDKVFLTKYLSLMLGVGTDLLSAINILLADFDKPAMRNFLLEVQDNVSHGQPFYKAFAHYPKVFSPTFINLVKAAEASGNLQKTFDELSDSLTRENELRSKIRAAVAYPLILLVVSLGVILFLTTVALPKIAHVFEDSGIKPPVFSQVVFAAGLFIGNYASVLFIGTAVMFVGGGYVFSSTIVGRRLLSRFIAWFPLTRKVYRELSVQRFAGTMSSLLKAGLPIVDAINVSADTVASEDFKLGLRRVASEGLAKGLTVGDAFKREVVFPKVVTNLIAISEKAGHLEEVLQVLSEFYTSSIDTDIKTLVSILEPVLLLTMGTFVALIALSIILPIYQLTSQF